MSKRPFDKYYTRVHIAKRCIDTTFKLIKNVSEVIEPSAGNGSFSLQIPGCIAYDIEPEHDSISQQDFLALFLPYKKDRLFIGNPPFGEGNKLSVSFFKHAIDMCDTIAFIMPSSQYNNNQTMYEFDLIHSELLPLISFSGHQLLCCFNIYTRPSHGWCNVRPLDYTLKDVNILEWDRRVGDSKPLVKHYDYGLCSWGSVGREIFYQREYASEKYIIVNNLKYRAVILNTLKTADWKKIYPNISTPRLNVWQIYKYLKEQIPELN